LNALNKVKIGQTVSLNLAERKLANFLAEHRGKNNRNFNVPRMKFGVVDDAIIDLEGMAGEIAFCKLFNVYPDMDIDCAPPHPSHDCVLPDGMRVDVKTTKHRAGKLLVDARRCGRKADGVDLYALMVGTFPGPYDFRGFIEKRDIVRPDRIGLFYGNSNYIAEQSELRDSYILIDKIIDSNDSSIHRP